MTVSAVLGGYFRKEILQPVPQKPLLFRLWDFEPMPNSAYSPPNIAFIHNWESWISGPNGPGEKPGRSFVRQGVKKFKAQWPAGKHREQMITVQLKNWRIDWLDFHNSQFDWDVNGSELKIWGRPFFLVKKWETWCILLSPGETCYPKSKLNSMTPR